MTITNGYTTLKEYKARFYDEGQGDTKDNGAIEQVIESVSRSIDGICWQRFFANSADETRYFTAEFSGWLRLPERIISVTTLKTDDDGDRTYENSWTEDTDFELLPYNAALDGEPYRWVEVISDGSYTFPVGVKKGVEIDGKFGWSAAPGPIVEACLLGSHLTHSRRNSPYGVSGASRVGGLTAIIQSMKDDPLIMEKLSPYIMRF